MDLLTVTLVVEDRPTRDRRVIVPGLLSWPTRPGPTVDDGDGNPVESAPVPADVPVMVAPAVGYEGPAHAGTAYGLRRSIEVDGPSLIRCDILFDPVFAAANAGVEWSCAADLLGGQSMPGDNGILYFLEGVIRAVVLLPVDLAPWPETVFTVPGGVHVDMPSLPRGDGPEVPAVASTD